MVSTEEADLHILGSTKARRKIEGARIHACMRSGTNPSTTTTEQEQQQRQRPATQPGPRPKMVQESKHNATSVSRRNHLPSDPHRFAEKECTFKRKNSPPLPPPRPPPVTSLDRNTGKSHRHLICFVRRDDLVFANPSRWNLRKAAPHAGASSSKDIQKQRTRVISRWVFLA